jgi:hypothetical protein
MDSWPRMNTRFGTRPADGCMTVNDGWKAEWEGRGTRSRGQGESGPCMSDNAKPEFQDASPTTLTPRHDSLDTLSILITQSSDFVVQSSTGLNHRIRFSEDAERIANGLRIASASAGHSASIPRSLSAVRFFLFTFLARSGKGAASLPHPPLRTGREGFPSSGSSRFKALHDGRPANATV